MSFPFRQVVPTESVFYKFSFTGNEKTEGVAVKKKAICVATCVYMLYMCTCVMKKELRTKLDDAKRKLRKNF